MIIRKLLGPDTGLEAGAGFIENTLPTRGREIDPYDDQEFVVEGSQVVEENPEIAGKTREEIFAELKKAQDLIAAERTRADPVAALQATLAQVLNPAKPRTEPVLGWQTQPQSQMQAGPQESAEARKNRIQEMWLSDPEAAAKLVVQEQQGQLAMIMANNQAQMSRELMLTNGETKKVYDKYSDEIEAEVGRMPPMERVQNPRVYQTAVERIRSRHQDEFVNEAIATRIEEAVNAKLKELGLDPAAIKGGSTPVVPKPTLAGDISGRRPPATTRSTVVIPKWVAEEAERQGLDPKFYYNHLKSNGRI